MRTPRRNLWRAMAGVLLGAAAVAILLLVTGHDEIPAQPVKKAGAATAHLWVTPDGGACKRTGRPARFDARRTCSLDDAVDEARPGDRILVRSGSYGAWKGTDKAISLVAEPGERPQMKLDVKLDENRGWTIDGFRGMGGVLRGETSDPRNLTIRNSSFSEPLSIDGPRDSRILLDRNTHRNISFTGGAPARIHLPYQCDCHSGVTIRNSLLDGGSTDGVQSGTGVDIIGNEFRNIRHGDCGDCHTDAIQLAHAPRSRIQGNWLHDNEDGITSFDGIVEPTISDNVVGPGQSDPDCVDLYSVVGAIVEHNTCLRDPSGTRMRIYINHKPGETPSTGNVVRNNIAAISGPDVPAQTVERNLSGGAGAPNLDGVPEFSGGDRPSAWSRFTLAPGSAGVKAATNGRDVGIRRGRHGAR